MMNIEDSFYRGATLDRRRRNCRTDTTRTRLPRAILIRSRSRLRSSSLVTKYCALPWIAASRISSSSGSRQICSAPTVSTTEARAAISRTSVSASPGVYLNRRINRGRISTSAISTSCDEDVTALNLSRRQAATTCPGGPEGFTKAETQTLLSSRATSGTAYCFDLSARLRDFSFDLFLRCGARPSAHFAHQTIEVLTPLAFATQSNGHPRFFFETKGRKRTKNALFVDRLKSLFDRSLALLSSHVEDYSRHRTLGSMPTLARSRTETNRPTCSRG